MWPSAALSSVTAPCRFLAALRLSKHLHAHALVVPVAALLHFGEVSTGLQGTQFRTVGLHMGGLKDVLQRFWCVQPLCHFASAKGYHLALHVAEVGTMHRTPAIQRQ